MSRHDNALKYFYEKSAEMERRIQPGIEQFRKGDTYFTIKSANGPLPENITIEVEQKDHEFRFGANIFMLDEFESDEKNAIYREKFPECFNLATLPFYWSDLEPIQDQPRYAKDSPKIYRRPAPDLCVEYCREKGIEPKCHCLNYNEYLPAWARNRTVQEEKSLLYKRFAEIAQRYGNSIPSFEVTNETLQNTSAHSAFFLEDDFVEWSFRTADRLFPNNRLIINDYSLWHPMNFTNRTMYYMQIERLLREGYRVDSVGMQFHSFFPLESEASNAATRYNPSVLFKLMDLYATFGLPEQITEMTLPAYGNDEENEAVQAELVKNLYSIFFSHPAMEAIIYWNLVDGYAAFAPQGDMSAGENTYYGGLLRFDMSEKPAYKALRHLIREEWHTTAVLPVHNGRASFRGFYGNYAIRIHAGDRVIPLELNLSRHSDRKYEIEL